MTEKSREDAIRDMVDWLGTMRSMANIPDDTPCPDQSEQPEDGQAHGIQSKCLSQLAEQLMALVRSMSKSVAALQSSATPGQQNHLFILETQVAYLQRLAHDLIVVVELETTNESE
jgi:hypothetical protein